MEKEGPLEAVVGSAARRIARGAPCSVLLLTEPRQTPQPFQTPVVSVEFDEVGREMTQVALDLARREGALYLHAVREYELAGLHLGIDDGLDAREAEEHRDLVQFEEDNRLISFLEGFDWGGVRLRRACLAGKKGAEAAEYARAHGADLLFVADPRRHSFWDRFFRQRTELALQRLPCALFLYRPRAPGGGR
jgi:nucleotide-binding universal stress UspA family protein